MTTTTAPTTASGDGWTDPPDLIATRLRMQQLWRELERLLESRRHLAEQWRASSASTPA